MKGFEKGIPYEHLNSILKYDENSRTGLVWKEKIWKRGKDLIKSYYTAKSAGTKYYKKSEKRGCYYIGTMYNGKLIKMSANRIIMILHGFRKDGTFDESYDISDKIVIYKDGNSFNAKISNLEIFSKNRRNRVNATKKSKTGVRGVFWRQRTQKFEVTISVAKKTFYLGSYQTIEEARAAVVNMKKIN